MATKKAASKKAAAKPKVKAKALPTHITMVIDRSGSMNYIALEAQNAINNFLDDQAKVDGDCTILVADFDSQEPFNIVLDGDIKDRTPYVMIPRDMTPLNDAMGRAITLTDERVAASSPEKVIVVVATDGYENASKEWTTEQVTDAIKKREADGWEFVFLASGVQAQHQAKAYVGTQMVTSNVVRGGATGQSIGSTYAAASANTVSSRMGEQVAYAATVKDDGTVEDQS